MRWAGGIRIAWPAWSPRPTCRACRPHWRRERHSLGQWWRQLQGDRQRAAYMEQKEDESQDGQRRFGPDRWNPPSGPLAAHSTPCSSPLFFSPAALFVPLVFFAICSGCSVVSMFAVCSSRGGGRRTAVWRQAERTTVPRSSRWNWQQRKLTCAMHPCCPHSCSTCPICFKCLFSCIVCFFLPLAVARAGQERRTDLLND